MEDDIAAKIPNYIRQIEHIAADSETPSGDRLRANQYLIDRIVGRVPLAQVAPSDDKSAPPMTESGAKAIFAAAFAKLGPVALQEIQSIAIADMRANGRLVSDEDAELVIDGEDDHGK